MWPSSSSHVNMLAIRSLIATRREEEGKTETKEKKKESQLINPTALIVLVHGMRSLRSLAAPLAVIRLDADRS